DGYVKVLDFGLARLTNNSLINPDTDTLAQTNPGALMGTVRYMSPEQTRSETVSGASDIFALGIIFYELATGRHPFQRKTVFDAMQAIVAQTPTAPSQINPAISPAFDGLIRQMLEKESCRRPSTADVQNALATIRESGKVRTAVEITS